MLAACAAVLFSAILLTFFRYSFWRKKCCQSLPSTSPSFFNVFGDVSKFLLAKDWHIGAMQMILNYVKCFEKEQLICIWIFYVPIVFVIKSEAMKQVLKIHKLGEKSWQYDWLRDLLGSGLITSEGEKWKSRRRILSPCFHPNALRSFLTIFNANSQKLVARWQEETKKDSTCIVTSLSLCSLDIICETMFGVTIGALENENVEFVESLKRAESLFMLRVYSAWLWPDFIYWKTKSGNEAKHHIKVIKDVCRAVVEERKKIYLSRDRTTDEGKNKTLLDVLLDRYFITKEITDEDIIDEASTFILAGHETIAMTTMWALYTLGLHPEIQAKVHEELDRIFGDDTESYMTEKDIRDMKYLDCVLKECSRLYTTLPLYSRQINEDISICGHTLPRGAICVLFPFLLHKDEEVFPDPEIFDPDRFSPENSVNIPECGYIPFSVGPRMCIGYKYAEMELKSLVSTILRNFTVESLDQKDKVLPILGITLHPSIPIRIRLRSRSNGRNSNCHS